MHTVVRCAAAVYEALSPVLEEIQRNIRAIKNNISTLSEKVGNLTEEVEQHKYETAVHHLALESQFVSANNVSVGNLLESVVNILSSELLTHDSKPNSSMRSDLNSVKSELNCVNEKIDRLQLRIHSIDTRINSTLVKSVHSDLTSLNSRLSSLNDLIRDDLNDVKTGLDGVSNATNAISDKIDDHDAEMSVELMEIYQNLTQHTDYTCGGTGGWRRAVYLDMKDPSTNCPSGWNLTGYSKRTCGRATNGRTTCDSVFFPVSGGPYSQVCGRIRAYQWGITFGFYEHGFQQRTINDAYFSGVAIMHGRPRKHIWTFVAGNQENDTVYLKNCPCDTPVGRYPPVFVGDDYFCEAGYIYPGYRSFALELRLHSNDTLWDGKDCYFTSSCCSFNNPPYFTKQLSQKTSDDLELRMCLRSGLIFENVAVELVELYVKHDIEEELLDLKESLSHQTNSINNINVYQCGGTGGWRRAVYLDMKDAGTNCPSGWNLTGYSKRTCGRANTSSLSCDSVFFPVNGGPYSQVCGRIGAYQWGFPNAFLGYFFYRQRTIDSAYFSGVAVMHGNPRQHIWTFVAGYQENRTVLYSTCPCDIPRATSLPPFVEEDYFCESGYVWPGYITTRLNRFRSNDILWDGRDCHSTSTCCSFNNPPYFTKTLNQTTTDDLELRMCLFDGAGRRINAENIAVELVELYVK